jgi:hypothetical protein
MNDLGDRPIASPDRRAELERIVAEYFQRQGYAVSLNALLTGRSGITHEIDVLADKSDLVTTFRIAVECRAGSEPIDKGVVYKLVGVMADLGIAKGVIASTAGARVEAEILANHHLIDLWGTKELASMIAEGPVPPRTPMLQGTARIIRGGVTQDHALSVVTDSITPCERRRFGKPRPLPPQEQLVWLGFAWYPMWCIQITTINNHGRTTMHHVYEGIDGTFIRRDVTPPPMVEAELPHDAPLIPHNVSADGIQDAVFDAFDQWATVSAPAVMETHGESLRQLGFGPLPSQIEIEGARTYFLPLWIAILHDGPTERAMTVDGVTGLPEWTIGDVATRNLTYLRRSLTPPR